MRNYWLLHHMRYNWVGYVCFMRLTVTPVRDLSYHIRWVFFFDFRIDFQFRVCLCGVCFDKQTAGPTQMLMPKSVSQRRYSQIPFCVYSTIEQQKIYVQVDWCRPKIDHFEYSRFFFMDTKNSETMCLNWMRKKKYKQRTFFFDQLTSISWPIKISRIHSWAKQQAMEWKHIYNTLIRLLTCSIAWK